MKEPSCKRCGFQLSGVPPELALDMTLDEAKVIAEWHIYNLSMQGDGMKAGAIRMLLEALSKAPIDTTKSAPPLTPEERMR